MILVDTSVWIDFVRNTPTAQAEWLDRHLEVEALVVGDLVLAEVLQGFGDDRGFNEARRLLARMEQVVGGGQDLAVQAARNFRRLRRLGVTVRGTVDVLIATRCLTDGLRLLHNDRDFDAMQRHLGAEGRRLRSLNASLSRSARPPPAAHRPRSSGSTTPTESAAAPSLRRHRCARA